MRIRLHGGVGEKGRTCIGIELGAAVRHCWHAGAAMPEGMLVCLNADLAGAS